MSPVYESASLNPSLSLAHRRRLVTVSASSEVAGASNVILTESQNPTAFYNIVVVGQTL